jgi:hypothetical protein
MLPLISIDKSSETIGASKIICVFYVELFPHLVMYFVIASTAHRMVVLARVVSSKWGSPFTTIPARIAGV